MGPLETLEQVVLTLWVVRLISVGTMGASALGVVAAAVFALRRASLGVSRSSAALIVGGLVALAFRSAVPLVDTLLVEPEWVSPYLLFAATVAPLGVLSLAGGITRAVSEAKR